MDQIQETIRENKGIMIIIGAVLLIFLVFVLLPQDFWVNLSMKLFP